MRRRASAMVDSAQGPCPESSEAASFGLVASSSRTMGHGHRRRRPHDVSPEQEARVQTLTDAELQEIDAALVDATSGTYRKSARIVGTAMTALRSRITGLPDVFFA